MNQLRFEVRAEINSEPLAVFANETWADDWRASYCNTGLVIDNEEWRVCDPKKPHGLEPDRRIRCECGSFIVNIIQWDGGKVLCEECAQL